MSAKIVQQAGSDSPVVGSLTLPSTEFGTAVVLSNQSDVGVHGWEWLIIDAPEGSAYEPPPVAQHGSTFTLTPDLLGGTILVQLTTYLDALRTEIDAVDRQLLRIRFAAPTDWVIPSAVESTQADLARGWKIELNRMLRDIQPVVAADGGGGGGLAPTPQAMDGSTFTGAIGLAYLCHEVDPSNDLTINLPLAASAGQSIAVGLYTGQGGRVIVLPSGGDVIRVHANTGTVRYDVGMPGQYATFTSDGAGRWYVTQNRQAQKAPVYQIAYGGIPAYTFAMGPGSDGIADEIRSTTNGPLVLPGANFTYTDTGAVTGSVLVVTESPQTNSVNGIWQLKQVGDGSHPWILRRRTDLQHAMDMADADTTLGGEVSVPVGAIQSTFLVGGMIAGGSLGSASASLPFTAAGHGALESLPGLNALVGSNANGGDASQILIGGGAGGVGDGAGVGGAGAYVQVQPGTGGSGGATGDGGTAGPLLLYGAAGGPAPGAGTGGAGSGIAIVAGPGGPSSSGNAGTGGDTVVAGGPGGGAGGNAGGVYIDAGLPGSGAAAGQIGIGTGSNPDSVSVGSAIAVNLGAGTTPVQFQGPALSPMSSGGNVDVDITGGNATSRTPSSNFTYNFVNGLSGTNPLAGARGFLILDNAGAYTIGWGANVIWVGGAPTIGTHKYFIDWIWDGTHAFLTLLGFV